MSHFCGNSSWFAVSFLVALCDFAFVTDLLAQKPNTGVEARTETHFAEMKTFGIKHANSVTEEAGSNRARGNPHVRETLVMQQNDACSL